MKSANITLNRTIRCDTHPILPEFHPDNDNTKVGKKWENYNFRLENIFLANKHKR